MKIKAVIFDVYTTILEVGPPPPGADALWQRLFGEMLGITPPLTRTQFSVATAQVIARLHAHARSRGIQWPEIQWPSVVLEVIPSLAALPAHKLDDFLLNQMQTGRTLRLANGAAECLRWLYETHHLLGIASNSQAYTLRELNAALQGTGLNLSVFDRDVCFWSFEHGFSKPDPHVFRILTARLQARGIRPAETLMVGDRLDNDIEPARGYGWQTWLLDPKAISQGGGWSALAARLRH
ncbi:MAG: HAD family hydrolase [Verrucomicrobia bacterium]|nr:HAD family hydrolase [Verrucomicrobiota bacterium]